MSPIWLDCSNIITYSIIIVHRKQKVTFTIMKMSKNFFVLQQLEKNVSSKSPGKPKWVKILPKSQTALSIAHILYTATVAALITCPPTSSPLGLFLISFGAHRPWPRKGDEKLGNISLAAVYTCCGGRQKPKLSALYIYIGILNI